MTLYCDNRVQFGEHAVGGTRISHMSHLDKPREVPLLVTRGKSAMFKVQPLVDEPAPVPLSPLDALRAEWHSATAERRAAIEAEVSALEAPADVTTDALTEEAGQ